MYDVCVQPGKDNKEIMVPKLYPVGTKDPNVIRAREALERGDKPYKSMYIPLRHLKSSNMCINTEVYGHSLICIGEEWSQTAKELKYKLLERMVAMLPTITEEYIDVLACDGVFILRPRELTPTEKEDIRLYGVPHGYGVFAPKQYKQLVHMTPISVCICFIEKVDEERLYILASSNESEKLSVLHGKYGQWG